MNPETLINATTLKYEQLRKVKVLLTQYLMYRESTEESEKELAELKQKQKNTYVDLSSEMDLVECHRAIELAQIKKAKINLSAYGILIDES